MVTVFLSYLTSTVPKGVRARHSPGSLTRTRVGSPDAMDSVVAQVTDVGSRGSFGKPDHRVLGKGPSSGHRVQHPAYAEAGCKTTSGSTTHVQSSGSGDRVPEPAAQPTARSQHPLPAARE